MRRGISHNGGRRRDITLCPVSNAPTPLRDFSAYCPLRPSVPLCLRRCICAITHCVCAACRRIYLAASIIFAFSGQRGVCKKKKQEERGVCACVCQVVRAAAERGPRLFGQETEGSIASHGCASRDLRR